MSNDVLTFNPKLWWSDGRSYSSDGLKSPTRYIKIGWRSGIQRTIWWWRESVHGYIYIYMDMYNTIIYIYPKNLPYGYHGWHIWLSYDDPHSDVTSFHDVMWSGLGLVLSQNGRTIILDWCILIEPDIQLMLLLLIIKVYSYQYTVSNGFCYD